MSWSPSFLYLQGSILPESKDKNAVKIELEKIYEGLGAPPSSEQDRIVSLDQLQEVINKVNQLQLRWTLTKLIFICLFLITLIKIAASRYINLTFGEVLFEGVDKMMVIKQNESSKVSLMTIQTEVSPSLCAFPVFLLNCCLNLLQDDAHLDARRASVMYDLVSDWRFQSTSTDV